MKYKTLQTKKEPKEFIEIMILNGNMEIFTSALPHILPYSCTLEGLKEYYETQSQYTMVNNFFDDIELIELDIFESEALKSGFKKNSFPIKNLLAILDVIDFSDIDSIKYLRENINKAKISLNYLSNIL